MQGLEEGLNPAVTYHKGWAPPRFVKRSPQILFGHDAKHQQLHTGKKHNGGDKRCPALHRIQPHQRTYDRKSTITEAQESKNQAHVCHKTDGGEGECHKTIHDKLELFAQSPTRSAMLPLGTLVTGESCGNPDQSTKPKMEVFFSGMATMLLITRRSTMRNIQTARRDLV